MNERGLVIELSQLDETQYPAVDSLPVVGCLEWIQYQLDNSATVQEVLQQANDIRIHSPIGIHFLIADAGARAYCPASGEQLVPAAGRRGEARYCRELLARRALRTALILHVPSSGNP